MNIERALTAIGQRGSQPIAMLLGGKVYPIRPYLDEVNIDGMKYVVLVADESKCLGEPNDEDDSCSIFSRSKVAV